MDSKIFNRFEGWDVINGQLYAISSKYIPIFDPISVQVWKLNEPILAKYYTRKKFKVTLVKKRVIN